MTVIEHHQVPLDGLTTFAIGGLAARVISVSPDVESVSAGLERAGGGELFILGGGSNLLAADRGYDGTILRIAAGKIDVGETHVDVEAGAEFDEFVSECAASGLCGAELLAGIPGSVGGAIVQNAGAYGQHVAGHIQSVTCIDVATREVEVFDVDQCRFGYRSSVFKCEPGRWVIVSATFAFERSDTCTVAPREIKDELGCMGYNPGDPVPVAAAVAAVRTVRARKDHIVAESCRTAGSFFKSVVMPRDTAEYEEVKRRFEAQKRLFGPEHQWIQKWTVDRQSAGSTTEREMIAGSLIGTAVNPNTEPTRFRPGSEFGKLRLGRAGCNTIVNRGDASASEVLSLAREMRDRVLRFYGVGLVPEVVLVGDISL